MFSLGSKTCCFTCPPNDLMSSFNGFISDVKDDISKLQRLYYAIYLTHFGKSSHSGNKIAFTLANSKYIVKLALLWRIFFFFFIAVASAYMFIHHQKKVFYKLHVLRDLSCWLPPPGHLPAPCDSRRHLWHRATLYLPETLKYHGVWTLYSQ